MRCGRCGRLNASDAWDCEYCGAPLDNAPILHGRSQPAARSPLPAEPRHPSALLPTIVLALALVLIGVGGARASALLGHAMRPESPGDLAAAVCNELRSQSYDLLSGEIDTAPDPTAQSTALNPQTIASALKTLDSSAGNVTACTYQQISYVTTSSHGPVANFALTIQRAKTTGPQNIVLILTQTPNGTWLIARSSNLTATA